MLLRLTPVDYLLIQDKVPVHILMSLANNSPCVPVSEQRSAPQLTRWSVAHLSAVYSVVGLREQQSVSAQAMRSVAVAKSVLYGAKMLSVSQLRKQVCV